MPRTRALPKKKAAPIAAASSNGNGHAPEKKPPVYLASLYRNSTVVIDVPDPRFEEFIDSGIRLEVSSRYSDEAMKAMEEYRERVRLAKDAGEDEPPIDEVILDQLVLVTKRWWHADETTDGLYLTPGELLACTDENKRKVFSDDGWRWLRNLVLVTYMREANFFGRRPKTD
jgi:hypothetical protein